MALNIGNLTANVSLTGAQQFKRQLAGLVGSVKSLAAAWVSVKGAQAAFSLAKAAAGASDAAKAFRQAGFSIEEFRKATNGLISDADLIKKFNLARSLGVTKDAFLTLAKVAQASARTTGQDIAYLFESAIIGAARQSPQILDNLGISIQKTGNKAKFMADLIAKGNEIIARAGDAADSAMGPFDRFTAAISNLATEFGENLRPAMDSAAVGLTGLMNRMTEFLRVRRLTEMSDEQFGKIAGLLQMRKFYERQARESFGARPQGGLVDPDTGKPVGMTAFDEANFQLDKINKKIEELLPSYGDTLKQLGITFGEAGKPVKEAASSMGSLKKAVEDLVPAFVNARTSVWEDLRKQRLFEGKTEVGVGFLDFLQSVDENSAQFIKALESMEAAAKDTANSFGQAFGDNRQAILDNLQEGQIFDLDTGAVTTDKKSAKGRLGSGISSLLSQTASGLVKLGVTLPTSIQDVVSTLLEVGQQIVGALFDLGKSLAQDVFATSQRAGGLQKAGRRAAQAAAAPFLAAALVPIGAALTAVLGPVVLTVVSALTYLAVSLSLLTAGMIALSSTLFLVGAGFAQIQDTQNSERLGRAFDNALARSVAPLESFVFQLMALAPVLELVMTGFNRLVGETLTDLPEVLFNAFKTVGLGALALAQAYQQAMITLNNVLSAMGVGFAGPGELEQTLDGLAEMYAELFDLTFSEALIQAATDTRILGEAATSTADALDRVTRNLPEGFKVANAAFQAASPELPGGTPFTSGVAEQGIVINGDLIVTGATDTGQLAQNILDAAGRDRFTNWGNSQVTGRYNWGGAN